MVVKATHKKLKIEHHERHYYWGWTQVGYAVLALLVLPILMLLNIRWQVIKEEQWLHCDYEKIVKSVLIRHTDILYRLTKSW